MRPSFRLAAAAGFFNLPVISQCVGDPEKLDWNAEADSGTGGQRA
jgi:hypothetical protein